MRLRSKIMTVAAVAGARTPSHADALSVCMQHRQELHDRAMQVADLDERMRMLQRMPKCHPDPPRPPVAIGSDATHDPGFVTIDRFDATSRLGVDVSYLFSKGSSQTFVRVEPHLQVVDHQTGMGAYAALPVAYAPPASGSGDLEIGGFSAQRFYEDVGMAFRVGITLPTGSTRADRVMTNVIGSSARIGDSYLTIPHATSLRFSVSPLARWGPVFARGDLGFDTNLSSDITVDNALRVNAGVGLDFDQAAVMGELANVYTFGTGWQTGGAISLRAKIGPLRPYLSLVFPLPLDSSSEVSGALTVGLEVALR